MSINNRNNSRSTRINTPTGINQVHDMLSLAMYLTQNITSSNRVNNDMSTTMLHDPKILEAAANAINLFEDDIAYSSDYNPSDYDTTEIKGIDAKNNYKPSHVSEVINYSSMADTAVNKALNLTNTTNSFVESASAALEETQELNDVIINSEDDIQIENPSVDALNISEEDTLSTKYTAKTTTPSKSNFAETKEFFNMEIDENISSSNNDDNILNVKSSDNTEEVNKAENNIATSSIGKAADAETTVTSDPTEKEANVANTQASINEETTLVTAPAVSAIPGPAITQAAVGGVALVSNPVTTVPVTSNTTSQAASNAISNAAPNVSTTAPPPPSVLPPILNTFVNKFIISKGSGGSSTNQAPITNKVASFNSELANSLKKVFVQPISQGIGKSVTNTTNTVTTAPTAAPKIIKGVPKPPSGPIPSFSSPKLNFKIVPKAPSSTPTTSKPVDFMAELANKLKGLAESINKTSSVTTAPAVSNNSTAPAVSNNTTAPAVSNNSTAPAVSNNTTAPVASNNTTAPAASNNATAPAASNNTTAPAASNNATAPVASNNATAPAASNNTTAPAVSNNATAPAVSNNTTTAGLKTNINSVPLPPGSAPNLASITSTPGTMPKFNGPPPPPTGKPPMASPSNKAKSTLLEQVKSGTALKTKSEQKELAPKPHQNDDLLSLITQSRSKLKTTSKEELQRIEKEKAKNNGDLASAFRNVIDGFDLSVLEDFNTNNNLDFDRDESEWDDDDWNDDQPSDTNNIIVLKETKDNTTKLDQLIIEETVEEIILEEADQEVKPKEISAKPAKKATAPVISKNEIPLPPKGPAPKFNLSKDLKSTVSTESLNIADQLKNTSLKTVSKEEKASFEKEKEEAKANNPMNILKSKFAFTRSTFTGDNLDEDDDDWDDWDDEDDQEVGLVGDVNTPGDVNGGDDSA